MFDRLQQLFFISLGFSSGFQISSLFLISPLATADCLFPSFYVLDFSLERVKGICGTEEEASRRLLFDAAEFLSLALWF